MITEAQLWQIVIKVGGAILGLIVFYWVRLIVRGFDR